MSDSTTSLDADHGVLDKRDPLPTARLFVREHYRHAHGSTLLYSDDMFYSWADGAYVERKPASIRAQLYPWLETKKRVVKLKDSEVQTTFQPTKHDIDQIVDALKSLAHTDARPPCWLTDDGTLPDPTRVVVAKNGIVDLEARRVRATTPLLFTTNRLDYGYNADAPEPTEWLRFLDSILPDDRASIELLQEWFGYCLTPDTRKQKILMLIGQKRSGKGTIGRILRAMLGDSNVCAPTLSSMSTNFGLWALVRKYLWIVGDARLGGRTDQAVVTERLLSISGEDAITIDRKNLPPITETLPTRIMILTNELPQLTDASGALSSRFLILNLDQSFFGREDEGLTDRILLELPSILNWAIEGWRRLRERGRFVQPEAGQQSLEELNDLASPIGLFVREWCHVRPGLRTDVKDVYDAWCAWCIEQGRATPGNVQRFGRDLKAHNAGIAARQSTMHGERIRVYEGIDLTDAARESMSTARSSGLLAA